MSSEDHRGDRSRAGALGAAGAPRGEDAARMAATVAAPVQDAAPPAALCGMAMTEKQGGSDVRANTTRARPAGLGGARLDGRGLAFGTLPAGLDPAAIAAIQERHAPHTDARADAGGEETRDEDS